MRGVFVILLLTAPAWSQEAKPAPSEAIQRIRQIQAALASTDSPNPFDAFRARHQADFVRLESAVSAYIIAQLEASPKIAADELRKRLIEVLGSDAARSAPFAWRNDPPYKQTGPSAVLIVYGSFAWSGLDGDRVVVESYVLDEGKAKLAGRGGTELNGIAGRVQMVGIDELLVQGVVAWSSGANLPQKAALYRVNASGVSLVWQDGPLPGLEAADFAGYLLVAYVDYRAHPERPRFTGVFEVYSLENGTPSLIFRREN